jgi:hypothetical protein
MPKFLAKDATVVIGFGPFVDGTVITTFSAATSITGTAKSLSIVRSANTENVSAIGDSFEQTMPVSYQGSINAEFYVTGAPIFESKIGYAVKLTIDVDGAGTSTAISLVGIVTDQTLSLNPESTQSESVTIKLGVAGLTGWTI